MKTVKLGSLITISKGKKHTISEVPSPQSVRMLGIDDLRNNTLIRMTDDQDGVLACEDDVLIAWDGANAGTIGYGKRGYIGSTISRLRLHDTSKFYAPFIGMFLQSNFSYLRKTATGATIPHINRDALERISVPVFGHDDQVRIATLLSKVESLISRRREQLKQLDELLKSVFQKMFGDPVRNEMGWETVPLSKFGRLERGVSKHRPRNACELLGGKYPLIQTGEVSNAGTYITSYSHTYSDTGLKQSKIWGQGTLCITIAANIAKTGILTFDACFPDSVVGFTVYPNEANILFVHHLFAFFQKILEKNAPKAAQKNINLEILRNLIVPKPPLDLQTQFSTIVTKVEFLRTQYTKSLTNLESLYGTLSQKVFKGELDLSRVSLVKEADLRSKLFSLDVFFYVNHPLTFFLMVNDYTFYITTVRL